MKTLSIESLLVRLQKLDAIVKEIPDKIVRNEDVIIGNEGLKLSNIDTDYVPKTALVDKISASKLNAKSLVVDYFDFYDGNIHFGPHTLHIDDELSIDGHALMNENTRRETIHLLHQSKLDLKEELIILTNHGFFILPKNEIVDNAIIPNLGIIRLIDDTISIRTDRDIEIKGAFTR